MTELARPPAPRQKLEILLANPRGFCAGVARAIHIVEAALAKYGPPVYVLHEIVHNRTVVEGLQAKGAIFVDRLDEIPKGQEKSHTIFSAHGVPKSIPRAAANQNLPVIDATCPLVSKVHHEAEQLFRFGHHVILIGHANHPEVTGILGQLPDGAIILVETVEQVSRIDLPANGLVAYVTQTTLAIDEADAIIAALKAKFPAITGPRHEDICYATSNRQRAVAEIAPHCDLVIVLGSPNSSNSNRLVEVARRSGASDAILLDRAGELDWRRFENVAKLGITAGASAPESLVQELISACRDRFLVEVKEVTTATESLHFKLPKPLVA